MSRLVQAWEQSYRFEEDELAFLAESQKLLSRPFPLPQVSRPYDSTKLAHHPSKSAESLDEAMIDPINEYVSSFYALPAYSHVDDKANKLHQRLRRKLETAESLESLVADLQTRVENLQDSHELVKSKSLVMQSLWDGLVTRQSNYSKVIKEIRDHLTLYRRYERIHQLIRRFAPTSKISDSKEYLESFGEAVQHFERLKLAKGHLDAPLYLQRYRNLLILGTRNLSNSMISELECVTRKSSSRLRSEAKLQLISDINADFLVTVSAQALPLMTLYRCQEVEQELREDFVNVVQKYFSCRSSLLHHFLFEWDEEAQSNTGRFISEMVLLACQALKEEKHIADRLFGELLESHFSANFKQMLESFLVSILRKIRSAFEDYEGDKSAIAKDSLGKVRKLRQCASNEDQKRVLGILTEFFASTVPES